MFLKAFSKDSEKKINETPVAASDPQYGQLIAHVEVKCFDFQYLSTSVHNGCIYTNSMKTILSFVHLRFRFLCLYEARTLHFHPVFRGSQLLLTTLNALQKLQPVRLTDRLTRSLLKLCPV